MSIFGKRCERWVTPQQHELFRGCPCAEIPMQLCLTQHVAIMRQTEVRRFLLRTICVIGTGYVGLVTGACLADMGNQVTCVDIIAEKIEKLKAGILPIYEPGLGELVERNVQAERLRFTTSYEEGLANAEFIFIAVGTPTGQDGHGADLRYVESAARSIAQNL